MQTNTEQYHNLKPGLYIISTPIGNLDDISYRAVKILEKVDFILAEDTRKAKKLFNFLGIKYPKKGFLSYNENNEKENLFKALKKIDDLTIIGYVCDAGTPCISDPGMNLVNKLRKLNFSITPIPGVSALTTAISVCGFKFDQKNPITFWGFLPSKKSSRLIFLRKLKSQGGVSVVFETPHRANSSLSDCLDVLGKDCPLFVGRELTKKFETLWWGNISEYMGFRKEESNINSKSLAGEYVFIFDFSSNQEKIVNYEQVDSWIECLHLYLKPSELASLISKEFNIPKKIVYKKIIKQ
jgi:16S rRNA (cytidine1402-2'-O)-methyltransferase